MKKLFIISILFMSLFLGACKKSRPTEHQYKEEKLPTIVTNAAQHGVFDTIYTVKSEDKMYIFSQTKEYQSTVDLKTTDIDTDSLIMPLIILIIFVLIMLAVTSY